MTPIGDENKAEQHLCQALVSADSLDWLGIHSYLCGHKAFLSQIM